MIVYVIPIPGEALTADIVHPDAGALDVARAVAGRSENDCEPISRDKIRPAGSEHDILVEARTG